MAPPTVCLVGWYSEGIEFCRAEMPIFFAWGVGHITRGLQPTARRAVVLGYWVGKMKLVAARRFTQAAAETCRYVIVDFPFNRDRDENEKEHH